MLLSRSRLKSSKAPAQSAARQGWAERRLDTGQGDALRMAADDFGNCLNLEVGGFEWHKKWRKGTGCGARLYTALNIKGKMWRKRLGGLEGIAGGSRA